MPQKIEISYKTIIFTLISLLLVRFLYQIKDILLLVFVALILMGALNPTVNKIERLGIPRWAGILFIYLVIIGGLVGAIVGIMPPLIDQTSKLIQLVVDSVDKLSFWGISTETFANQLRQLGGVPAQILKLIISLFSNFISVLALLVVTFYLLIEHGNINHYLFFLFGPAGKKKAKKIIDKLEFKLGGWIRAEFILMMVVGGLSYFGFKVLNLKYALPLAILAGFLEIVPNIGPTVSAIPAILVGLMESPIIALLVGVWCFLVQQLENSFIVPRVMQKSVGVNPLVTILSLAIGFKIAGVVGAILAVPFYLFLETILVEIMNSSFRKKDSFKKPESL